jgi:hypothetical protein
VNAKIGVENFIQPFKAGSAMIQLKAQHAQYAAEYVRLIEPTMEVRCWMEKDEYYVHALIPSESNESHDQKLFYDVIFRFKARNKADETNNHIADYMCEAFSNNPAFLFSFTYVFNKNKCLLSNASKKLYSDTALREPAKIRNPYNLLGISKDLWFAEHYMKRHHLFRKEVFENLAQKTTLTAVLVKVKSQEAKLKEANDRDKDEATKKSKIKYQTREEKKQQRDTDRRVGKKLLESDLSVNLKNDKLKTKFQGGIPSNQLKTSFGNKALQPKR